MPRGKWVFVAVSALVSAAAAVTAYITLGRTSVQSEATTRAGLAERYGVLPVAFEPNRGQADARVRFLAHGSG